MTERYFKKTLNNVEPGAGDKAIDNYKHDSFTVFIKYPTSKQNAENILSCLFIWETSPEGLKYWVNVSKKLLKKKND